MNQIFDDILNSLGQHAGKEAHGMIFVKGVSNVCEIGTKQKGEAILIIVNNLRPRGIILFCQSSPLPFERSFDLKACA